MPGTPCNGPSRPYKRRVVNSLVQELSPIG